MTGTLESWEYGDPERVAERREEQRINRERQERERVAAVLKKAFGKVPRETLKQVPIEEK